MNTPTINTNRLILRQFTKEDIDTFYVIFKEKDGNMLSPWFPLKSKEEAIAFYNDTYVSNYQLEKGYFYAICLKGNNLPIGYLNMVNDDSYELIFGINKAYQGNGYMQEAINGFILRASQDGIPYITVTFGTDNLRTAKIVKNLGLKYCYSYEEPWNKNHVYRMYQINLNCDPTYIYKGYWRRFPDHFLETDL